MFEAQQEKKTICFLQILRLFSLTRVLNCPESLSYFILFIVCGRWKLRD